MAASWNILLLLPLITISFSAAVLAAKKGDGLPAVIPYKALNQFPESVDWDRRNFRFIVGSLTFGNLASVTDNGKLTVFVKDKDYDGNRTQGVLVDTRRNRVVTTIYGGGPSVPGGNFAAVAAYNLATKARELYVRLDTVGPQNATKGYFPNDVAVETYTGNLWITDSYRGLLWKVNARTKRVSVLQNPLFSAGNASCPTVSLISLNGIVYNSRGYLLVVNRNSGNLIKVNLRQKKGASLSIVKGVKVPCGDGLRFRSDGALVAVTSRLVYLIKSKNNWKSGYVASSVPQDPTKSATAAAIRYRRVYISYAYFAKLSTGGFSNWELNSTAANFTE